MQVYKISFMDHFPCKQGMEMEARSPAGVLFLLPKKAVSALTGLLIVSFYIQLRLTFSWMFFWMFPSIAKDFSARVCLNE